MNEPFAGNIFEDDHFKLVPGIAGETNLVPFYDIVQKSIRQIDDDTIIFWEPVSQIKYNLPNVIGRRVHISTISKYLIMNYLF